MNSSSASADPRSEPQVDWARAPFRHIEFGIADVRIDRTPDGEQRLVSTPGLGPFPATLNDLLERWAAERPEATFVARRGADRAWRRVSYAQALAAARAIGEALCARGLSAERPLLILSENDVDHALLALGAMQAGIPWLPVSTAYSLVSQDFEKLRHVLRLMTPGLVYCSNGERYAAAIRAAVPRELELVVSAAPPADRTATPFESLLATRPGEAIAAARRAVGPDTIAKFLLTSGSTSLPKAVINTQRMWCSNLQMIAQSIPALVDGPPVLVDWLPWNHTFGGNHNVGLTLFGGGTLYIDDGKPLPGLMDETLANLREIAPTVYFNVPKGFEALAAALEADPAFARHFFGRLKLMFFAGAGLSQPVWDSLERSAVRACGERIVIGTGLGMTETAPSALFTHRADVGAGMIGLPCPGLELKLARADGKLEARYRGPNVTPGYWRAPEATAAAFDAEGWFRSGDAVRFVDPQRPREGFVFDGRIAEDFKLATGTWVSVGPLRARIIAAGDPVVQDVVLTGIDRDELGMLVFARPDECRKLAAGLDPRAPAGELFAHRAVRAWFTALLTKLHAAGTGTSTRVCRALLLEEPPSIDAGEITDKGSINQRAVLARRAALVERLHSDDAWAAILRPEGVSPTQRQE